MVLSRHAEAYMLKHFMKRKELMLMSSRAVW
jgi:hypothetical protein